MAEQDDIFEIYSSSLNQPAYEGASRDYKNQHRTAILADADFLALNELELLQARSRHLSRNNSIVAAAESKYVTKLGAVMVQWMTPDGDEHTLMQELWDEFFSNPGIDNKGDGKTMQATWNHDRFQSGEALSRLVIKTKNNDNSIKLKVQHIESEYLPISYFGQSETANTRYKTRYGITFDGQAPVAYNFYRENYFGIQDASTSVEYVKVPATDVLHIFERLRANQWRGIPVSAPLLENIYALTDLRDATVDKQIAAAAISWIIERAPGLAANAVGSVRTAGETSPDDTTKRIIFTTRGGNVQYTDPGDKLHLVQSADIGNNLLGLIQELKHELASVYDMPYYLLSGDTSELSFAAIRGLLINFRDRLEYIHHFITLPDGLSKLAIKFQNLAALKYPAVKNAIATYQFPRYYGVDELKDTQDDILEVQAGFNTSENKRKERHVKYENVLKSRNKDKELGINGLLDLGSKGNSSGTNLTNGNQQANSNSSSN